VRVDIVDVRCIVFRVTVDHTDIHCIIFGAGLNMPSTLYNIRCDSRSCPCILPLGMRVDHDDVRYIIFVVTVDHTDVRYINSS
jgi:hypothetical protein